MGRKFYFVWRASSTVGSKQKQILDTLDTAKSRDNSKNNRMVQS